VFSLSAEDAAAIRAYYRANDRGRGNGRGRSDGLPPGIEKNLARGKALPPGIAKQYLPPDLLRRLPPPERGMEYVVVAGKLLLVEIATRVIHDILLDAVFD
jgi:Ni/Co efflux regulator RcnB